MIVHIVIFKFKEQNKTENIIEVKKRLDALVGLIPVLKHMEVGINFTESPRAFDMSLYSVFETKEDLDVYATHHEHLKVVEFIKLVTIESKIVDYNNAN